jgi:hypothetical protein
VKDRTKPQRRGERDASWAGGCRAGAATLISSPRSRAGAPANHRREIGYPQEFLQREEDSTWRHPTDHRVIARQDSSRDLVVCSHNPGLTSGPTG